MEKPRRPANHSKSAKSDHWNSQEPQASKVTGPADGKAESDCSPFSNISPQESETMKEEHFDWNSLAVCSILGSALLLLVGYSNY